MILIVYTTAYRKGSDKFQIIAKTMLRELKQEYDEEIISLGIVGKKELTSFFNELTRLGKKIDAFHFILDSYVKLYRYVIQVCTVPCLVR